MNPGPQWINLRWAETVPGSLGFKPLCYGLKGLCHESSDLRGRFWSIKFVAGLRKIWPLFDLSTWMVNHHLDIDDDNVDDAHDGDSDDNDLAWEMTSKNPKTCLFEIASNLFLVKWSEFSEKNLLIYGQMGSSWLPNLSRRHQNTFYLFLCLFTCDLYLAPLKLSHSLFRMQIQITS